MLFVKMQLFIITVVLLSCVATVSAVAGCHSDRDKDHRPRENCTAAGFSDVPTGLELTTKVLLFPNNLFPSLSWTSFQILTEIYEIDLTANQIPKVTSGVSPILRSLSILRLGSNRLTSLSDGSFAACPGLTELYLENNAMDSLSDHTFSGLSKLEILDLSFNRIKVLPGLMLHPLSAIETLLLEDNKINVMPDNWFSQKEEVPYLYLSANPWACSCSLGYLRRYLEDYEYNVYVRDGLLIKSDAESVVCDSPQQHKGQPVMSLEESDLCSPTTPSGPDGDFDRPMTTRTPYKTTTAATTIPATTAIFVHPPSPTTPAETTSAPTPTPALTPAATTPIVEEFHTVYHRVVTWSWYHSFTTLIEWSDHSGSVVTGEVTPVGSYTSATHLTLPTTRPSTTGSPATTTTATTKLAETTESVPSTVTSATPELQEVTTTPTVPPWLIDKLGSRRRGEISAVSGAGVFCIWLFAGCLLLCVVSALCILATVAMLITWYRRAYKPLSVTLARRPGGSEGVRMLTYSRTGEKEVAGGVMALYRSILFIQREGGEATEREDGGIEGEEGGEEVKERFLVNLEPTGGTRREEGGERGGSEERGVYRKTLYRLFSKEEEIEGWRDVLEECRVPAEDGGRSGGGVSRKRFSVILREEREEAGGGREELDLVVGGWEVKNERGEELRSSWGEWLADYLPSMPWGSTTPPEGEAAQ